MAKWTLDISTRFRKTQPLVDVLLKRSDWTFWSSEALSGWMPILLVVFRRMRELRYWQRNFVWGLKINLEGVRGCFSDVPQGDLRWESLYMRCRICNRENLHRLSASPGLWYYLHWQVSKIIGSAIEGVEVSWGHTPRLEILGSIPRWLLWGGIQNDLLVLHLTRGRKTLGVRFPWAGGFTSTTRELL